MITAHFLNVSSGSSTGSSQFGILSILCDFMYYLSGPVATVVAGVIIVLTAIMFAAGEAKGMFGTMLRILMGIGVAVGILNFGTYIGLDFSTYCPNASTSLNL